MFDSFRLSLCLVAGLSALTASTAHAQSQARGPGWEIWSGGTCDWAKSRAEAERYAEQIRAMDARNAGPRSAIRIVRVSNDKILCSSQ
jgi:hypothetical protein